MTTAAKPDIPALADELKDMATFYMERPCVPDGLPLALTDMADRERKSVASMLLRATAALTTAVEIGRAVGIEAAAKICDEKATANDCMAAAHQLTEDQPNEIRSEEFAALCRHLAAAIRSSTPPLDLDALTERIARVIASELDGGEEQYWEHYAAAADSVLSAIGIRARED